MKSRDVVFSCCVVLTAKFIAVAATPQVEVVAKSAKVKVRQETIATVKKGEKFRLLKTDGPWVAIVVGEGDKQKRGWVLARAVKMLVDPAIDEDSAAPDEPVEVRLAVDLTQCSGNYGPNSILYFKVTIGNESGAPLDFKVAELELKADDQPMPPFSYEPNVYYGAPVFPDASTHAQVQSHALSYLKDTTIAAGAVLEGWMAFNISSLQQLIYQPGGLAGKTWILEGKVGAQKVRWNLSETEIAVVGATTRPSKLDASVQVIEVGSRINALNAVRLVEALRAIPVNDRGCVLVLKDKDCLFDGVATQHFQQQQQQLFQFGPNGNMPVVSTEGGTIPQHGTGYHGYFGNGQISMLPSEAAGVLTILGRRPNTGDTLIKHLEDKSPDIRAAAAQALTPHLAEAKVVEALAKTAHDDEPKVRSAAVGALGGTPVRNGTRQDDSVDTVALIHAMTDAESSVRVMAAQSAKGFLCNRARIELRRLLEDPDLQVKIAASGSLGVIKDKDAVPRLKELQKDENAQLKTVVIDALKNIGELTGVEAALAKLDGGMLQDADYAELGKAKEKRAVAGLIARLKGTDNFQIGLVGRTLGEIGDSEAVEPLIQVFSFGNRNYGMAEIPRALGKLGDKRAIEPLRGALKGSNQNMQWDLRTAIFEGLLMLKAPNFLDEAADSLKKSMEGNRFYEVNPLLVALGKSRDEKAIAVLQSYLSNPQTCNSAGEGLMQLGTKKALLALEKKLMEPDFQMGQFIIQNRQWQRSPAAVAMLKRIAAGGNQFSKMAATNALNNLQPVGTGVAAAATPSPIGYLAPAIEAGTWLNGKPPTASELQGKVVVVCLWSAGGSNAPDLPPEVRRWQQKFEKEGLVVLALWNEEPWNWDAGEKGLVAGSETNPKQQQQAVIELLKVRDVKYRVGLVAPSRKVVEQFGGPATLRFAFVDRAGILQAVRPAEDAEINPEEFDSLLEELLAEPLPSAATLRTAQQAVAQRTSQDSPRPAAMPEGSFDPAAASWTIPAHNMTIWSVKFSPDSKWIASTDEEGIVKVWEAATGKLRHTLRGHSGNVRYCAFTHDGKQLLTSGFDNTIRVWDAASGAGVKTLTDDAPVYFLSLLGDDRTVISASGDTRIRYWNLTQGTLEGYFVGHTGSAWVCAAATVEGNSTIVSGSPDRTAKIWEFQTGELRHTLSGHALGVQAVAIASNAQTVASGANDGEVKIWDVVTGEADQTIPGTGAGVYDLDFSPDNKTLAVARGNHSVTLYDVPTGKPTRQFNRGGWCVDLAPNGRLMVSGSDDRALRIWSMKK